MNWETVNLARVKMKAACTVLASAKWMECGFAQRLRFGELREIAGDLVAVNNKSLLCEEEY